MDGFFPTLEAPSFVLPTDTGLDPDDPQSVFDLLALGHADGIAGALLTITGVIGGAPRSIGAQMAVLADGRFCGYVSGGCVEAAVASEAIAAIEGGRDVTLRFGEGSPFLDIQLPCGGGIDILVHVRPDPQMVETARQHIKARQVFSLAFCPQQSSAELSPLSPARARSEWRRSRFVRHYHPLTRLVLIGEGPELVALTRLGKAAGLPVEAFATGDSSAGFSRAAGAEVVSVAGTALPTLPVDPFTAVVFLLHDRSKETRLLEAALQYEPFYLGALGSRRTHAARLARLADAGVNQDRLARLRGPIGLFGPTRTASALAVSVLGEITDARMRLDG